MKTVGQTKHEFFVTLWELRNTNTSGNLKIHLETKLETLADILDEDFPEEYREQYEEVLYN